MIGIFVTCLWKMFSSPHHCCRECAAEGYITRLLQHISCPKTPFVCRVLFIIIIITTIMLVFRFNIFFFCLNGTVNLNNRRFIFFLFLAFVFRRSRTLVFLSIEYTQYTCDAIRCGLSSGIITVWGRCDIVACDLRCEWMRTGSKSGHSRGRERVTGRRRSK